ncbi:MAG: AMP-binding protein [Dehalococcoidales bacterium]|nr:AMP-binding protein [Dehalococcoidales bacterium]
MRNSWIENKLGKDNFIYSEVEELTFDDFYELIQSYAYTSSNHIKKNEKICFMSKNILHYAVFVNLIPMLGGIFVPLNPNSPKEEILNKMDEIKSNKIFYDKSSDLDKNNFKNIELIEIIKSNEKKENIYSWPKINETFCILFTSGSSGKPKAVELSLENIETSSHISQENLNVKNSDIWLLCMPPYHAGGLSIMFRSLIYRNKIYIENSFDPERVISLILDKKVTIISLVPTMLFKIIKLMENKNIKVPKEFNFILCGGASVPNNLISQAKKIGILVVPTYGMTETSSQIATASPLDKFRPDSSVGKVLNDINIKFNKNNEILVQSKVVAKYYNNKICSSWLYTGDTGYLDNENYLYITGRVDDLIISGGENINPLEIEQIINTIDYVEESVVVGIKDAYWGEILSVVLFARKKISIDEIKKHLSALDKYKIPKKIFFYHTSLPKLDNGKYNKKVIREYINENS